MSAAQTMFLIYIISTSAAVFGASMGAPKWFFVPVGLMAGFSILPVWRALA